MRESQRPTKTELVIVIRAFRGPLGGLIWVVFGRLEGIWGRLEFSWGSLGALLSALESASRPSSAG
eukprot:9470797-Pyramimonas_sp.AAC.1